MKCSRVGSAGAVAAFGTDQIPHGVIAPDAGNELLIPSGFQIPDDPFGLHGQMRDRQQRVPLFPGKQRQPPSAEVIAPAFGQRDLEVRAAEFPQKGQILFDQPAVALGEDVNLDSIPCRDADSLSRKVQVLFQRLVRVAQEAEQDTAAVVVRAFFRKLGAVLLEQGKNILSPSSFKQLNIVLFYSSAVS